MHEQNSFITLTYNDENLPEGGDLADYAEFQKFMKRLRFRYCRKKIRFYMCAEYGDKYARPHYHALLFGCDFHDKYQWRNDKGNTLYRSPTLEELWPYGNSEIGNVTYQSAAYVSSYIHKKQTGLAVQNARPDQESIEKNEWYVDSSTGEMIRKKEPYTRMSLRPGIGYDWYQKYKSDLWPQDRVVLPNGKTAPVPKFYRKILQEEDPDLFEKLRLERREKGKQNPDNSDERREVKERSAQLKMKQKERNLND